MTKARVKIMICYINHICLHLAATTTTYVNLWRLERKIAWMDIVVTRLGGTGLSIINRRKIKQASKVSTNVQNTGHIKEFLVSLVFPTGSRTKRRGIVSYFFCHSHTVPNNSYRF